MSFLRSGHVLIAILFGLVGVLSACGGESSGVTSDSSSISATSTSSSTGVERPKAPSFSVSTGGESTFSLGEHSGEVVLLYFSFPG